MDQTKVNGGAPALSIAHTDTLPDEEEGSWLVHAFDGEEQRAMNSLTARLHEGLGKPRGDTDEVMLTRRHDPLPLPLTEASIAQLPQHIVASLTRLNLMPDEKREKMDAQVLQQEKSVKVGDELVVGQGAYSLLYVVFNVTRVSTDRGEWGVDMLLKQACPIENTKPGRVTECLFKRPNSDEASSALPASSLSDFIASGGEISTSSQASQDTCLLPSGDTYRMCGKSRSVAMAQRLAQELGMGHRAFLEYSEVEWLMIPSRARSGGGGRPPSWNDRTSGIFWEFAPVSASSTASNKRGG